ncbi:MAG: molybdopterin molybdotransferase MoeA [Phreatobacter sp.]|nr:molybdopterin molybdotransferase MoeA [Phreatobacter sp.]
MAQLSSDQFAFGGQLLSVEEALSRVGTGLSPVAETEEVELLDADGRILAGPLVAPVSLPPFFNSAVDGYAVRFADLTPGAETRLAIGSRVPAGAVAAASRPAEAVRIFTGAPMPEGCDTVFMQEDVRLDGDAVVLPPGLAAGANCRPAGEDLAAGGLALAAGRLMAPETIALAAALGLTRVTVRRRVRVAVFSTGNEIVSPGTPLGPAQLYDSNRFMLQALLRRLGVAVTDLAILPDDRSAIAGALCAAAADHDLILTSGGVSTGEEDHVKTAVEAVGSLTFWRLAIKPGRPVAMGVIPSERPGQAAAFIGLPGNPVAVFVTFAHVVRPFLAVLAGGAPTAPMALPVRAAFPYRKKAGRREYVRVALRRSADGLMEAVKHPRDGAGVITSLTETDGLIELPEPVERVAPGDTVAFLAYGLLR